MKPQRLDLNYHIDWQSNWHVGSGYASAAADRLVRRLGGARGAAFVPGSLVKGVLRHHCERLALALGLDAVAPHATSIEQNERLVKHFKPLDRSALMVDRLFGTRCQGECLFVDNAIPVMDVTAGEPDWHRADSALRTRTAMDRVTGTVMERHLFTTETAGTGMHLAGRLRGRHPAGVLTQDDESFPFEYALLLAALLGLDTLGSDKSAGLGRCRVTIPEGTVRWNGHECEVAEALSGFRDLGEEWTGYVELLRSEKGVP